MDEFSKWLKSESEKDKAMACNKCKHICDDCPYQEDCEQEELLNSLDEW